MDLILLGVTAWLAFWVVEPAVAQLLLQTHDISSVVYAPRTAAAAVCLLSITGLTRIRRLSRASWGVWTSGLAGDAMKGTLLVPLLFAVRLASGMIAWAYYAVAAEPFTEETAVPFVRSVVNMSDIGPPVALFAVAATMEESLVRGAVLPRLRRLCGSWTAAVLLSSAAFALLHLPCKLPHLLAMFSTSALLSIVFLRNRSLVTVIVAHFLMNCASLVL